MGPPCPECAAGKHVNCTGWSLDEMTDEFTDCGCAHETHPWNKPPFPTTEQGNTHVNAPWEAH